MEESLILTGFMGVGKTAAGRALAELLGWDFVDLDREIEAAAGKSIPAIFAEHGESHFRELESAALERVVEQERTVIATGGGVLLRERNRRMLSGRKVFYLHAPVRECLRRLKGSPEARPLLAGPDPEARALRIFAEREVLYEEFGRKVATEGIGPEEVARAIADELRGSRPTAGG